jgi:hypothetical protein
MTNRNSVVLDLGMSSTLAQHYWQQMIEEATSKVSDIRKHCPDNKSLAASLAYFWDDKDKTLADLGLLLPDLECHRHNLIYDGLYIQKLVDCGLEMPRQTKVELNYFDRDLIAKSLNFIEMAWPAAYREAMEYISGFIIVESGSILSMSGPAWFGAVFLGNSSLQRGSLGEISTSIIHEVGHLVLYADCTRSAPLKDLHQEFYSPFVKKKRPALMVLHAQMAMARMVLWLYQSRQFLVSEKGSAFLELVPIERHQKALEEHARFFLETMDSIRKLPFTADGLSILNDFEAIARILEQEKYG